MNGALYSVIVDPSLLNHCQIHDLTYLTHAQRVIGVDELAKELLSVILDMLKHGDDDELIKSPQIFNCFFRVEESTFR